MASSFGTRIKVSVFGQSHSDAVGATVEGLPSGIALDMDALERFMQRRAPGTHAWSTPRREADIVHIISGLNPQGTTCGTPLALVIENTNKRSGDYANLARFPRPGHADWVAHVKWGSHHDIAGGGHFSARLTAPLCAVGGMCMQVLSQRGIRIAAHLAEVAGIPDDAFAARGNPRLEQNTLTEQMISLADGRAFPVINQDAGRAMQAAIEDARTQGNSVGGIVECVICDMPVGVGEPMFDGVENALAYAAFGIPGVKGIEFGSGFEAARMRGSSHNDPYECVDGTVSPAQNDAGGVLGGISTGAPILFRLAFKPTSSIALEQDTVDLKTLTPAKLTVQGRHDPCIAPRAVSVVEAVAAITTLDLLLSFPADAEKPPTESTRESGQG